MLNGVFFVIKKIINNLKFQNNVFVKYNMIYIFFKRSLIFERERE